MTATVTLFRPAAIESRSSAAAETLAVAPPWSWAVFALAAAMISVALLLGAVLRVEVTGRARGAIVQSGAPLRVVCFVAQDDRRFIHAGDLARIELDELPKMDFGTLPARVIRIRRNLATQRDVSEVVADYEVKSAV